MFEGQVAYYLSKYLGQYVNGLDAESLKISVWRGDVELRNLSLKPEALQSLDLPIRVKAGLLGRLTIKVPWTKLGKEPVIVEFDRVYVLAGPYSGEGKADAQSPEEWAAGSEKSAQDGKMERVRASEMDWIQELEAKAGGKDGSGKPSSAPFTTLQSMIDPILGNLQLRLTNLHIRYEDEGSYPGHRLCLGLLLRKVSAHSVDEGGRKAFVTAHALQCLRKAVALQKLALYFDVDAEFMRPPTSWEDLSPAQWDSLFMPGGVGEGGDAGGDAGGHEYLVHPVSGDMLYTRRSKKFRTSESDPKQHAVLALESVALQYSRPQYAGTQALLTMLDTYQANAPYRFMKPKCRPRLGANARVWWNYAARAVLRQQRGRGGGMSWSELQRYCSTRKRYVPLYVRCLQSKQMGGDAAIAEMDKGLGEGTILLFRRLAHAKVEVDKRRNAGAVSRQQRERGPTWVGWLTGSNVKAGTANASDASSATADGSAVSPEEWKRFEELLASQSVPKEDDGSHDGPWTVRMQLQLRIATASLKLVDDSHAAVLTTSMHALEIEMLTYPLTTSVAVALGKAGVVTPMGPLLTTGLLAPHTPTPNEPVAPSPAALQPLQGSAFRLLLVRQPQDGSADACLSLELAPSYVTYNAAAVGGVSSFFATSQALDLTSLQAQVASRASQLQKVAALRLKALSEAAEKPKLILSLAMHAPKVAIPDAHGRCTLIADLGLFRLTSARTTSSPHAHPNRASAQPEAALYERFSLSVASMSAALVDGPFAWPSEAEQQQQLLQRGAGGLPAPSTQHGGAAHARVAGSGAQPGGVGVSLGLAQMLMGSERGVGCGRSGTVVPLLDRFQMCVGLEVATAVHPRLPQLRAHVHADPIQIHLSPFRVHRLLNIVAALSPTPSDSSKGRSAAGSEASALGARAGAAKPIWMTDAEFQTQALVLAWEGISGSTSAGGADDQEAVESRSYWQDDRVMDLPSDVFGSRSRSGASGAPDSGNNFLLALVPSHVDRNSAAEHPDVLVMQLPDGASAAAMRRGLLRSKAMMSAVAGLLHDGAADGEGDGSVGVSEDVFGFMLKHKDILTLSGTLAEVSLQVCEQGLAYSDADSATAAATAAVESRGMGDLLDDQPADFVRLGDEMPLLMARQVHRAALVSGFRLQHASVDLAYSLDRLRVGASMSALEVEDELEGGRKGERVLLARSSLMPAIPCAPGAGKEAPPVSPDPPGHTPQPPGSQIPAAPSQQDPDQVPEDDDDSEAFFDADGEELSEEEGSDDVDDRGEKGRPSRTPRHSSSRTRPSSFSSPGHPSPSARSPPGGQHPSHAAHSPSHPHHHPHHHHQSQQQQQQQQQQQRQQQLVSLLFLTNSTTSSRYAGVDTELRVKLAALHFTARRPTVACLMTLGGDMATIFAASPLAQAKAPLASPETTTTQPSQPHTTGTTLPYNATTGPPSAAAGAGGGPVVVRSGGADRTLVRLHLEMSALELDLEYEDNSQASTPASLLPSDDPPAPLLSTSVSNFSFTLNMHPATMDVNASLGDCVARHGALGPGNPYVTIASLRPGTSGSVITLQFRILSSEQSYLEPRVPDGKAYYTLTAHLSAVQLVYLSSFVTELMAYLTDMLAMQLPPLIMSTPAHPAAATPAVAPVDATAVALEPMLLLLDITADAPVIVMPESSHSPSYIELDLGHMALSNSITWGAAGQGMAVMSDDMQLSLTELSVTVGTVGGLQGANLIKQLGSGFQIQICRPLAQTRHSNAASHPTQPPLSPAPLPPLTVAVSIPELTAVVVDTEYKQLLRVLSSNSAETPTLPPPADWVVQHFAPSAVPATTPPAATTSSVKQPPTGPGPTGPASQQQQNQHRPHSASERDFTRSVYQVLSTLQDHLTMKATVSIGRAQLQLWVESQESGHAPPAPDEHRAGGHRRSRTCVRGVPSGQSLVLSTADVDSDGGDGSGAAAATATAQGGAVAAAGGYLSRSQEGGAPTPSLLTMEYRSFSGCEGAAGAGAVCAAGAQCVRMRLQQLTLVLDAAFLMTLLNFVAPMPMLQGPVPIPYSSPEIYLTALPFAATSDAWLSPEFRLIADAPCVARFQYDGSHTRLVLPKGLPSSESLPLIVVGAGKTLTLRNVSIVNCDSLAAVLQLGVGAQLIAREEDGVRLVPCSKVEDDYSRYLLMAGGSGPGRIGGSAPAATSSSAALLEFTVDALGANLHIVDHSDAPSSTCGQSLTLPGVPSSPTTRMPSLADSLASPLTQRDRMLSSTTLSPPLSKSNSYQLLDAAGDGSVRLGGQPVNRTTSSLLGDAPGGLRGTPAQLSGSRPGTPLLGSAAAAAAAALQQQQQRRVFRRVAVMMDVSASYSTDGSGKQVATASVAGLGVKTHTSFSGAVGMHGSRSFGGAGGASGSSRMSGQGPGLTSGLGRRTTGPQTGPPPPASPALLTLHNTILEPCDMTLSYSLLPGASQQLDLSISAVALKLSPQVLQQLLQLQKALTAPLMVPPAHAPLLRCELYERVWTSQRTPGSAPRSSLVSSPSAAAVAAGAAAGGGGGGDGAAAGKHGVDALAAERGVTVWRPTAPSGYVILGDVVTAGSAQPQSQVAVLAVNSGLVAHPLGYTLVWSFEGGAVWRPIPPPHYLSMGCVTTSDSADPPSVRLVGCVHERVVVEAALGSCLLMCAHGNLWGVGNVGCTFEVSEADQNLPTAQLYDLRSPLSVPPAALHPQSLPAAPPTLKPQPASFSRSISTPVAASPLSPLPSHPPPVASTSSPLLKPPQPLTHLPPAPTKPQPSSPSPISTLSYSPAAATATAVPEETAQPPAPQPQLPAAAAAAAAAAAHAGVVAGTAALPAAAGEVIAAVTGQRSVATCVEFERLWWDKGSGTTGSAGISFWRPVTPPGYMSLGDCMVVGIYAPPRGVMVLRGSDPGSALSGGGPPLLAMPMQYERIWPRPMAMSLDATTLCLWRPSRPRATSPSAASSPSAARPPHTAWSAACAPTASTHSPLGKLAPAWQRPNLRAWITDPRTCGFVVALNDSPTKPASGSAAAAAAAAAAAQRSSAVVYIVRADAARAGGKSAAGPAVRKSAGGSSVVGGSGGGGARDQQVAAVAPPLSMDLRVTRVSLLLRSNRSVPLMEVDAGEVTMNYVEKDVGIMKCIVSMWSYNLLLAAWEPIVEPWQLLLQLDSNCQPGGSGSGKRTAGGGGGTSLRLTSTQDNVQVAVAYAALAALLEAAPDWIQADGSAPKGGDPQGKQRRELLVTESNTMTALVDNSLGMPAQMLLDWGDHQEVIDLAPGCPRQVAQPLPYRTPSSHHRRDSGGPQGGGGGSSSAAAAAAASLEALVPCVRLLVDVLQCCPADGADTGLAVAAGTPVGISLQLSGPLSQLMPESRWGLTTRRVPLPPTTASPPSGAEWNERFILKLPFALSRQLLQPKSTPAGLGCFAGTLLSLRANLEGASTQGAVGSVLGSVDIPLLADWVGNEVLKLLAQAHRGRPSAAAAAHATAVGGAGVLLDVQLAPSAATHAGASSAGMRLKLRLSVDGSQVDTLWRPFLKQLGPGSATGSSGVNKADAALGRRALQLRGTDSWSPIPYGSQILSAASRAGATPGSGSVIPVPLQPYGAVLESSLGPGGVRREVLRSLFQLVNTTQLLLEVCLVKVDGGGSSGGWTMLQRWSGSETSSSSGGGGGGAATASQPPKPRAPPTVEEAVVFEHQRFIILRGWSHNNLLPTDRNRYSQHTDGHDSRDSFPQVPLLPGWEWEGVWQVEKTGNVDPEGWSYSFNWPGIRYPPLPQQASRKPTDFVRRRKWVRRRQLHGHHHGHQSADGGSPVGGIRPASLDSGSRRVLLGQVAPGDKLPLPYGWEGEGAELQVRPVVPQLPGSEMLDSIGDLLGIGGAEDGSIGDAVGGGGVAAGDWGEVSHKWSRGSLNSGRSVDLTALGSSPPAQLLCCSPVNHSSTQGMQKQQHPHTVHDLDPALPVLDPLRPCWLSMMVDHDALAMGPGGDVNRASMQDWRVTVRAPLCLENALPVAGFFQVFERKAWQPSTSPANPMAPPGGPTSFAPVTSLCAEGHIQAGGRVEVFSVDTRQQVRSRQGLCPPGPGTRCTSHSVLMAVSGPMGQTQSFSAKG
ncbi:MAG: hypothetical protein WDW36_001820 [Sanguina aurantia]